MAEPRVHLIVFSRDRPLQLHGMLTSVFRHWRAETLFGEPAGAIDVAVLVRGTEHTAGAYEQVAAEFPGVRFVYEFDFATALQHVLEDEADYVCFGCDDVVYTAEVDVRAIHASFVTHPGLLGYSLRLGKHTAADMFGREMPQPLSCCPWHAHLTWDATAASGDWGYSWEVLGTFYPAEFVRRLVDVLASSGQADNPSRLEHHGAERWREATGRTEMACSWTAHLVVPTVNLVQQEFGNGIVGPPGLDVFFLLDCWNRGLRLDVERYRGMTPPSWRVGDFFLRRAG